MAESSPDLSKIAFARVSEYLNETELVIFDIHDNNFDIITDNKVKYYGSVIEWQPSGLHVVFTASPDGIYIAKADGSELRGLKHEKVILLSSSPKWSPDGHSIAFVGESNGFSVIHIINLDDLSVVQVTDSTMKCNYPAWHPQDDIIAFFCELEDGTLRLMQSKLVDMNPEVILNLEYRPKYLKWSPDGSKLGFWLQDKGYIQGLFVVDIKTKNLIKLTSSKAYSRFYWSPDSSRIAFFSDNGISILEINNLLTGDIVVTNAIGMFWINSNTLSIVKLNKYTSITIEEYPVVFH